MANGHGARAEALREMPRGGKREGAGVDGAKPTTRFISGLRSKRARKNKIRRSSRFDGLGGAVLLRSRRWSSVPCPRPVNACKAQRCFAPYG